MALVVRGFVLSKVPHAQHPRRWTSDPMHACAPRCYLSVPLDPMLRSPLPISMRWQHCTTLLALLLLQLGVRAQGASPGTGMHPPDPTQPPMMTVEPWTGLPKGYRLPERVDLSKWFPPAGDQGQQGSCVAWALCYGLMSYRQNRWNDITYEPGDPMDSTATFSPAYLYNFVQQSYVIPGQINISLCDDGTNIEWMMQMAMLTGACSMEDMPYDTALASCMQRVHYEVILKSIPAHIPPAIGLGNANFEQWRYHLAEGRPILIGFAPTTEFIQGGFAAQGKQPYTWKWYPINHLAKGGGHAVVCTGYDRTDSTFSFMNSWGQHWGYRGHFKATEERLEQACGFAYILANDSTADWPTAPGEPADDDHLTGTHVREEFKPGEFQQINGKKVQLTSLHPKGHEGVVQLFDTRTDSLMRSITVRADQPYDVYGKEERVRIELDRPSLLSRVFGRPVRFTMTTHPVKDDPYLRERQAQIRRFQPPKKE